MKMVFQKNSHSDGFTFEKKTYFAVFRAKDLEKVLPSSVFW